MKPHPAFHRYIFMACSRSSAAVGRTLLLVVFLLSTVAVACRQRASLPGRTDAPLGSGHGGTLIRRLEEPVATLNPICRRTLSERYVAQYLFSPLIYLDANLVPAAGLAQEWSIAPDGRVYTFTLDTRATFSDGRKVTAGDVLFTIERIADAASIARDADAFIDIDRQRTRIVSPTQIEIAFKEQRAGRMQRFADVLVLPRHVYGRGNFCVDHDDNPVGSGPYVLEHRDANRVIVVRRQAYWRESPPIYRVILKFVSEPAVAWRAVKIGQVDESYVPSTAWEHERAAVSRAGRLRFLQFYTPRFSFVSWNTRRPVLRDVRVRHALAVSFDAETAARHTYEGTARVLTGPLPPESPDYETSLKPLAYAPMEAMRLFAAAGWRRNATTGKLEKDGVPLQLEMLASITPPPRLAEAIQDALAKMGVEVTIITMDQAAATARMEAGEFDAAFMDIDFNGDPDLYPLFHSSQVLPRGANLAAYRNADVDRLLAQARTETVADRRHALHRRVHAIVAAEQPYSWYVQVTSKWAVSPRIEGVRTSPMKGLFLWYPGELAWRITAQQ